VVESSQCIAAHCQVQVFPDLLRHFASVHTLNCIAHSLNAQSVVPCCECSISTYDGAKGTVLPLPQFPQAKVFELVSQDLCCLFARGRKTKRLTDRTTSLWREEARLSRKLLHLLVHVLCCLSPALLYTLQVTEDSFPVLHNTAAYFVCPLRAA